MKPLISIQYLRALAAIAVLLYHEAEDSTHWFNIGGAGVDLFFVISGFIMFAVTENKESNPKIFFWRRLIRIVPLYWCATFLVVLVCLIRPHFMWGADIGFVHVVKSVFFIPQSGFPTNLSGWTLNIEMFFYIVVALALFLPRRLQVEAISILLGGLVAFGICLDPQSIFLKAYTNTLLLEFVAGLWLGRLWIAGRLPRRYTGIVLFCIGLLTLGIEQYIDPEYIMSFRPIYWGIPAMLIIIGALSVETNGGIFQSSLLKALGDASYSIYLLHGLIESSVDRLHFHMPMPMLLQVFLAVVLSGVAGLCVYRWFERPLNAFGKKIQAQDILYERSGDSLTADMKISSHIPA